MTCTEPVCFVLVLLAVVITATVQVDMQHVHICVGLDSILSVAAKRLQKQPNAFSWQCERRLTVFNEVTHDGVGVHHSQSFLNQI